MSTHNSVASSNRRRDSQQSWTGSEIFRSQSPNDVVVQNNSQVKLSGKAWGRIKKFLLCKTDFPSSIYYIVGNEFCERFSYYGMKAILILYLTRVLMLGDDTATAVFHSFSMLCYFTPLFGAMLADGWLGKYRTILYVSVIYCIGNLIVSMTSLPPLGAGEIPGPMIGLFLIALGTGGIKPCVSAFGGDQFTSDQSKLLQSFFSVFYFAINAGSLLSMLITPVLRGDVKCYGDDCYPLAFGVPAALMLMAITLFWFGRNKYKRVPQTDNILLRVTKAVSYALKKKITSKGERKAHWMDWASDRYDAQLIEDIKALFKVLFMFLPLPVFWTLFDQQGSRWVLQAGQMDGDAGFLGTMKPDQMQAFNPLFIIILIPLFETVIYPLLRRPKPLKRMCAGMFLATVAFIFAGFLQMKIQSEEVIKNAPSERQANLQVINSLDCPASLSIGNKNITVTPYGHSSELNLPVTKNVSTRIQTSSKCYNMSRPVEDSLSLEDKEWYNLIISEYKNQLRTHLVKQNVSSPPPGKAKLCTVLLPSLADSEMFDIFLDETKIQEKVDAWGATNCVVKTSDQYKLTVKGEKTKTTYVSSKISLKNGGIYTAIIEPNKPGKGGNVTLYKDLEARNVSMLYQIPQYFVITSGEIMFSITGLEFAYSQAPASMKSCLQAAWLMTVAFGNLIVVIEAESRLITNQTTEFFFFAGMLFVVMVGFAVMAKFYRYVESPSGDPVAVPVDSIDDKTGIVDLDELSRI